MKPQPCQLGPGTHVTHPTYLPAYLPTHPMHPAQPYPYPLPSHTDPMQCPAGCSRCALINGTVACSACSKDYTLWDTSCRYCKDALNNHCLRCKYSYVCGECAANYTLVSTSPDTGYCVPECRLEFCKRCEDGNPKRCAQCPEGRYLDAAGACQKCAWANCGSCGTGGSPCTSCTTQYTFDSATAPTACVKCADLKCATCKSGDPNTCTKCKSQ